MATLFKTETKRYTIPHLFSHKTVRVFIKPPAHLFLFACKWKASTAFAFYCCSQWTPYLGFPRLIWYTTGAAVRTVLGGDIVKGFNYNQAWNAARIVWKRADLQKKSCGVGREKGGFLEWRPPFLFVIGDSPHVCEAAFRLLIQMRNTETSWRTMNRAMGVYAYIVLTALNVFQPNKHFITAASLTAAALLHQQKMIGS